MQIRTGIAIVSGIGIGCLIGMTVEDKTKEKMIYAVKKRIVEALTGEKWQPAKKQPYRTSYKNYYNSKEKKAVDDLDWKTLLLFEDEKSAHDALDQMQKMTNEYHYLSIMDIASIQNKPVDYTWDRYGWNAEEVSEMSVAETLNGGQKPFYISLPCGPHYIE